MAYVYKWNSGHGQGGWRLRLFQRGCLNPWTLVFKQTVPCFWQGPHPAGESFAIPGRNCLGSDGCSCSLLVLIITGWLPT